MSGTQTPDRRRRGPDRRARSDTSFLPGRRCSRSIALVLGAATLLACEPPDGAAGPPDMPLTFLQERVREVIRDVEAARAEIGADSAESAPALMDATVRLQQLAGYYLPVLAAREQAGRAARVAASDPQAARAAMDSTETLLRGIVRAHGRHFEAEFREPLERLQDARTALDADDREEARRVLGRLEEHLESIFYRGGIVLEGSELDRGSGRSSN